MKVILVFKTLVVFLILSAAIYGGYHLLRGADIGVPTIFQPAGGVRLLLSMEGFQFAQSTDGKISWRMFAKDAGLYGDKEAKLEDVEINFNSPDGSRAAKLLGETATMDTLTGNSSIRRGSKEVRIITSDGYLLTTNSLFWKAGERLVWTPEPFKLLGSEIYLEGVGLSASADMRSLVVKNHVKAVLQE
jgi:hypothetical protein